MSSASASRASSASATSAASHSGAAGSATAAVDASPSPSSASRGVSGPLLVLTAATLWGTTGTAANFAPSDASPLSIGAATMGIGGLLTLLLGGRSAVAVLRTGSAGGAPRRWAPLGGLCVAVYPLAFYTSMAWAGVATGTVVTIGCSPVFATLLERLLHNTELTARWLAATVSATAGCAALVLTGHSSGAAGSRTAAGVALGLLAGGSYVVYAYCASRVIRAGHTSRASMGALFGLGATVLLPVLTFTGGSLLSEARGLAVAAYLSVVPMCLAYVLFGAGLARVQVSAATTLSLFEPVVAALLGVAVIGERLGALAWTGIALVLLGLLLLTVRRRRRPASC